MVKRIITLSLIIIVLVTNIITLVLLNNKDKLYNIS